MILVKAPPKKARRELLIGAVAGAASLALPWTARAQSQTLTVADSGGPFGPAWDLSFVKPFEADFGVKINHIARQNYPSTEIKANVETKAYTWEVVIATLEDVYTLEPQGLLEPLDWNDPDMNELLAEAKRPTWAGMDIYTYILGFRTDKFPDKQPQNWADFWDVKKFPGRRALQKHPIGTLEIALMADGVAPSKLYPLDVDRAFKKLDQLRPYVSAWWTGGAQATQMLQSAEVDLLPLIHARAQTIIDSGGPVKINWNQGIYSIQGWVIPKGNPKADLGRKFVKYCANAKRQATWTKLVSDGPSNPKAYQYIDEARKRVLPTFADNFKVSVQSDAKWWGPNKDAVLERFNSWILS
jgi:putative spermidine/putrescine transport system substrate-binding protein